MALCQEGQPIPQMQMVIAAEGLLTQRCAHSSCIQVVVSAEALAEAVYLLECPSALSSDTKAIQGHVLVCLVSEPCRRSVPWPYEADCGVSVGLASHSELSQVTLPYALQDSFQCALVDTAHPDMFCPRWTHSVPSMISFASMYSI